MAWDQFGKNMNMNKDASKNSQRKIEGYAWRAQVIYTMESSDQ